jgi:DNA-binding XRE family transcriptional regulator
MADEITPEKRRVGATIKAFRDANGLTQAELAAALGVSRSFITNIELGRKYAPLPLCKEIARLFRISPAAITIEGYDEIKAAARSKIAGAAA